MAIPDHINDVAVEFAPGVNRQVQPALVDLLMAAIHPGVALPFALDAVFISSAADHHVPPSRHVSGHAVDISRVNHKRLALFYPGDGEVRGIVDALIAAFQICGPTFVAREIFGPGPDTRGIKLKLGRPWPGVKDHLDHIHLSEGDRASISGCPWYVQPAGSGSTGVVS
ncbi:MAG: hypothetical protein AB1792_07285 [Candidatus Zixiibacteriota bacterium]